MNTYYIYETLHRNGRVGSVTFRASWIPGMGSDTSDCFLVMLGFRLPVEGIVKLAFLIATALVLNAIGAVSVAVPSTSCYVLDRSSRLVDFSGWIGQHFEYEGKESDLVVRFCKDVETRSQKGYVDFGRFNKLSYFQAGSGNNNFSQGFYNGDLENCEQSYDKLGRTAQVNIICGNCANSRCKGGLGCICNATYESTCRVLVEMAIPCEKAGPRVFEGFTVGFHPRSREIVYNGMTQFGFERPNRDYSFRTEETQLTLYLTAIASRSALVQRPVMKVYPEKGLEVNLAGTGSNGNPPTTLSPSTLIVNWRCDKPQETPYEVNITIPIEGYDRVQFSLMKLCEYKQDKEGSASSGWATFGVFSCVFAVASTIFCCAGFIYKTRVERLRGIDALPGMTIFTALLETVGTTAQNYSRPEDLSRGISSGASWEQPAASAQETSRKSERKYGAI